MDLSQLLNDVNDFVWGPIMLAFLVGTGIFLTIRLKFLPWINLWYAVKMIMFHKADNKGDLSPFQSLMTALSATVGTGNIVGGSGAILIGGPGAIFWMWVIAFFAMATIYAEAVLAQETKVTMPDGQVGGGPVYYIRKAFPGRLGVFLAGFFAVAIILALGCVGCMVQVNSISATCKTAFGIPTWIMGALLAVLSALVLIGGMKCLIRVTETITPLVTRYLYPSRIASVELG